MPDRFDNLVSLVLAHLQEIQDISPAENEYYFVFRNKSFSIRAEPGEAPTLFVYPKWQRKTAELVTLLERGITSSESLFVPVEPTSPFMAKKLRDIFEYMNQKYLGIDDLLDDLGV